MNGVFVRIGRPEEKPFTPDPFQLEALEAIAESDCLVTAPTGSGKTWIAEQAIRRIFEQGGRVWYASPLKALTNAKWVEFSASFGGDQVGILTGDTKENADAPIIVGTTEILRNQLYDAMHKGENLDCDLIVLDEAHFLGDEDRGVVWEEIMIYLPSRINLLMLSATIGNSDEIAAWLETNRSKPCVVIREETRPVPLYPLFLHPAGRLMPLLAKKRLYGKVDAFVKNTSAPQPRRPYSPNYGDIIEILRTFDLLPAIFFLKSRSDCDAALRHCRKGKDIEELAFDDEVEELLARFPYLKTHRQLSYLYRARVAAHHGGQLPAWKFLVEAEMKKGRLDAIFATSTVAAGVNFPARTIVLFNSDQFNGRDFQPLTATEFHQMTGRAGRRGLDKIGFMLAVPGRFMDLKHVAELLETSPEEITSRIKNDFSMILNLLLSHTPEEIRTLFGKSLSAWQARSGTTDGQADARLWEDFQRHLDFLKAEAFVDPDGRLTDDGTWTSQLRLDQPLLIAECLRRDVFPKDDPALLAAVTALFVYDGDQNIVLDKKRIPRKLKGAYDLVVSTLLAPFERLDEAGFHVNYFYFWPAAALYYWARDMAWSDVIERIGIADGDLVSLISRTADNLRQIASLRDTHPEIAQLASRARDLILREPVVLLE